MITGYLDPYLVACPPSSDGLLAFEHFIDALLLWRELGDEPALQLFSSNRSYDVLHETGFYPLWEPISERLATLGIRHIQAKDVVAVADKLLMRTEHIEDAIGLSEFLFDHSRCLLPAPVSTRPQRFGECLVHLGIAIWFRRTALGNSDEHHVVLSRGIEPPAYLSLAGAVADADGPQRARIEWPVSVECNLQVVPTPALFLDCVDTGRVWVEALRTRDPALLLFALREAIRRKAGGHPAPDWSVHPQFSESVFSQSGLRQEGVARSLLRACLETVFGERLSATHHIRTGQGAEDPQVIRVRDGARAWRRDVDHDYHLHYWLSADLSELAGVVLHNDLSIPA